ncbi:MAG TPA: DUF3237 family protein [Steroidobacteraceae bacterium]|nr:DUF3237 family protein [Steroidobacteraceae bacterium]
MDADDLSRRRFLGGAATAALSGLAIEGMAGGEPAQAAAGAGGAEPIWFQAPDPSIARAGLRWAFSATVFFADRVLINSMYSSSGRGFTSVGGGEIWGPRLTGRVLPHSGADYYKASFSTYYMLEASDGALIFIHNRGTMRRFKAHYEPGRPLVPADAPTSPGSAAHAAGTAASGEGPPAGTGASAGAAPTPASVWTRFRATPVFTAPKGRHDWMNRTVFVADATRRSNPDHTVFTYYEVL